MKRTPEQVARIVERVETLLQERNKRLAYNLAVPQDGWVQEGEWVNVLVAPDRAGVRGSEFAEVLGAIDEQLRQEGIENVLLVPANPARQAS